MIKDINRPEVNDILMALVNRAVAGETEDWAVFLINKKEVTIQNILVSSRGYGAIDGESKTTTVLRQYFDGLGPQSALKVEPILPELFSLNNEYFVTFYIDRIIHDKKFIFLPDAVRPENMVHIPVLDQPGILLGA
jgi:hypothetical protein